MSNGNEVELIEEGNQLVLVIKNAAISRRLRNTYKKKPGKPRRKLMIQFVNPQNGPDGGRRTNANCPC